MAEITLVAEPGRTTGSAASRRLRAAGRVPGVVYGHGVRAASVSVDGRELRHALSGEAGLNQLLSLEVGGDTHLAIARSLQRHPVRQTVLHVDFQIVSRDEIISADVPLTMVGEAKEVEREKGLVEMVLTTLAVKATPANIPAHVEVDVSAMNIGGSIKVGDLTLPSGVTTEVSPDEVVAVAEVSRAALEFEAEEEAAAGAAAAEAEAALGEAPRAQTPGGGSGTTPAPTRAEEG